MRKGKYYDPFFSNRAATKFRVSYLGYDGDLTGAANVQSNGPHRSIVGVS